VTLISYSAHYLTDGQVPAAIVGDHARGRGGRGALRELLDNGFLHETANGYEIHDYLDFNDSRAEVEEQRAKNRNRQERHRSRGRQQTLTWDGSGDPPRNAVTNGAHTTPLHTKPEEAPQPPASGGPDRSSASSIWQRIRDDLRGSMNDATFHIYIEPLGPPALAGDCFSVEAPDRTVGWVRERFQPVLEQVGRKVTGNEALTVEIPETEGERRARLKREANEQRQERRHERALAREPDGGSA
jgi:hypothetical protein